MSSDELIEILTRGNAGPQTFSDVRAYVKKQREHGESKQAILARLEALRGSVSEDREDILLEVMDCLVGACSPHMKID